MFLLHTHTYLSNCKIPTIFHPVILAAKTSTLITSGAPVSSSSTDANKAAATLPARWASLPASLAKKSTIPKVLVSGIWIAYQTGVKDSALTKGRAFYREREHYDMLMIFVSYRDMANSNTHSQKVPDSLDFFWFSFNHDS